MKRLLILISLPGTLILSGQKVFLDEYKSPQPDLSKAKHYLVTDYENNPNSFKVTFFNITGEKESECNYLKSSRGDAQSVMWFFTGQSKKFLKDGKLLDWFKNGQLKNETDFREGKQNGKASSWFESGQLKSEKNYIDNKIEGKSLEWYENGQLKSDCSYINGLHNGEISTYWKNGKIKRRDYYKVDKIQSGTCYDSLGNELKHFDLEILPQYKGGDSRLISDISNNLIYPVKSRDSGIQGKVLVKFAVNELGSISNIEIVEGINTELNNEAIRVTRALKRFTPGYFDGEAIKVYFIIPITFAMN